jgi:hypothetical protein
MPEGTAIPFAAGRNLKAGDHKTHLEAVALRARDHKLEYDFRAFRTSWYFSRDSQTGESHCREAAFVGDGVIDHQS